MIPNIYLDLGGFLFAAFAAYMVTGILRRARDRRRAAVRARLPKITHSITVETVECEAALAIANALADKEGS